LKPELVWLNGACFRKNPISNQTEYFGGEARPGGGDTVDAYEDDEACLMDKEYGDEYGTDDGSGRPEQHDVQELANGKFSVKMQVASAFYPMIIGKKGASKKRIEHETRTRVSIPRQGSVENEAAVSVTGGQRADVLSACNRIELIVESSRSKMGFTHFISIPLNTPQMQDSFRDFKAQVLELVATQEKESFSVRKIDESVFQTPSLLHLTVGMLALMDDNERKKACDLLEECKSSVIQPIMGSSPLHIRVKGLEIMNDDPAEVAVIYAKIHPGNPPTDGRAAEITATNPLQEISDALVHKFVSAGLMAKQFTRVKLHMTVLNTKFLNKLEDEFEGYKEGAQREMMDGRSILQEFANHDFGQVQVNEIHLSQRRAGRRTEENYYFPSHVMKL